MTRQLTAVAMLAIACLAVGCSRGDMPDLGKVTGYIKNGDQAIVNATIEFYPATGRPSVGRTDSTGRFELVFDEHNRGAAVGLHTVKMTSGSPVPSEEDPNAPPKKMPKPKEGTEAVVIAENLEVKPGKNEFTIDISKLN